MIEQSILWACLLEATARKPGNVHPEAAFSDLCYADFVESANVVAPVLATIDGASFGRVIRDAIVVTQRAVGKNSNLGIVLLLAPLVVAARQYELCRKELHRQAESVWCELVEAVLSQLTADDTALVFEAIRCAQPGGMGAVSENDVESAELPNGTLREVMRSAAGRDRIAAEYAEGFPIILNEAVPFLCGAWNGLRDTEMLAWEAAIIQLHVWLMSRFPDTLIARKCGDDVAERSAEFAGEVLAAGGVETVAGRQRLREFDEWLRADGHRRNPGTTADFVAATLFVSLQSGQISNPLMGSQ